MALIVVLYKKYLSENNDIDGNFFLFLSRGKKEGQATHINLFSSLTGNPIGEL